MTLIDTILNKTASGAVPLDDTSLEYLAVGRSEELAHMLGPRQQPLSGAQLIWCAAHAPSAHAALWYLRSDGAPIEEMIAALPPAIAAEMLAGWSGSSRSTEREADALAARHEPAVLCALVATSRFPAPKRAQWYLDALAAGALEHPAHDTALKYLDAAVVQELCRRGDELPQAGLEALLGVRNEEAFLVALRCWCRRRPRGASGLVDELAGRSGPRAVTGFTVPVEVVLALADRVGPSGLRRLAAELDDAYPEVNALAHLAVEALTSTDENELFQKVLPVARTAKRLYRALLANARLPDAVLTEVLKEAPPALLSQVFRQRPLASRQCLPALAELLAEDQVQAEVVLGLARDAEACLDSIVAKAPALDLGPFAWATMLANGAAGPRHAGPCPWPAVQTLYETMYVTSLEPVGAYLLGRLAGYTGWEEMVERLGESFEGTVAELADVVEQTIAP